jgi:hypothetical protein
MMDLMIAQAGVYAGISLGKNPSPATIAMPINVGNGSSSRYRFHFRVMLL